MCIFDTRQSARLLKSIARSRYPIRTLDAGANSVIAALTAVVNGSVVNEDVTRTIDASTAMVKITTDIKVEGSGKEYPFYALTAGWACRLHHGTSQG